MRKIIFMTMIFISFAFCIFAEQIVTTKGLSVREGPNVNTPEITQVPVNTKLETLDVFGDYILVQSDKIKGYVWEKLIVKTSTNITIGGQGASVNSDPNKNTTIGVMFYGTKVKIISVATTWYKISYDGKIGWIYAGYTKKTK
jgi:uncharacterized protein YgiM (DUF1202 family)